MIILICKEYYDKKYGIGSVDGCFYKESDYEAGCFVCGKKRKMLTDISSNPGENLFIFD